MGKDVSIHDLKDEVRQIKKVYPKLTDDEGFVLWFLHAHLVGSEEEARKALTGGSGDKSIDAIYLDEGAKQAYIVQGKFRQSLNRATEKRSDLIAFADLSDLPWRTRTDLDAYYSGLDAAVAARLEPLIERVTKRDYELHLLYVTTGRCSNNLRNEAEERARKAKGTGTLEVFDGSRVATTYRDYLEGAAPPPPTMLLRIASDGGVSTEGAVYRYDSKRQIEAWVFSMSARDVGDMYRKAGMRLFARNVRGFLGSTSINEGMAKTIREEPHNFWYYNNGVTIVCDDARKQTQRGKTILRVERPQVINGQQTTRTLKKNPSGKASVLVRVIKIPRKQGDEDHYDDLVSHIVKATNWQNAIKPSDLVSNDHIQVHLERELRKQGYQYIRKRMTKKEARRIYPTKGLQQIKKDELARAVAACELDPAVVRRGVENLFDERSYRSIFSSRSMPFYLSRYWLMKRVQHKSRGYPDRAYAKWVVLHHMWKQLRKLIGRGKGEKKFRWACEYKEEKVLIPLNTAIDRAFKAALAFFRANRGKGEKARDVSTFFMRADLDKRFDDFWKTPDNVHMEREEKATERFLIQLGKYDPED